MAKPNKKLAQEHKDKGNQLFAQNKFAESIVWYQKAIDADPNDHVLHSNKSAAYLSGIKKKRREEENREEGVREKEGGRERGRKR